MDLSRLSRGELVILSRMSYRGQTQSLSLYFVSRSEHSMVILKGKYLTVIAFLKLI